MHQSSEMRVVHFRNDKRKWKPKAPLPIEHNAIPSILSAASVCRISLIYQITHSSLKVISSTW